jgi:prepilin-type N-terminal cleavage/methylation domain-containing protein
MTSLQAGQARSESGFTLIDMLFVIAILALLSTLAIPGLMRARGSAQSASALGTVRVVNSAQLSFAITCGFGFYSPDLPRLGVRPPLATEAFLAPEMSSGATFIKSGYSFSMGAVPVPGAPASCNGLAAGAASAGYALVADPLDKTAGRYFGTNADATIFEDVGSYLATMPETGAPPGGAPIK